MVLRPGRDFYVRPPHPSPGPDALSHPDLPFKLLTLCLRGNGHATSKDHIDLPPPLVHRHQGDLPSDVHPNGHLMAPVLLAVASSSDPEKFYTLPDRALRYDGSRTTSLRRRGDKKVSSLSNQRTACHDTHDLHSPCSLPDRSY
jgi:hypothetical protein